MTLIKDCPKCGDKGFTQKGLDLHMFIRHREYYAYEEEEAEE